VNLGQIYLILYGMMALGFLGLLALFVAIVISGRKH
jgi:hypothetical protein